MSVGINITGGDSTTLLIDQLNSIPNLPLFLLIFGNFLLLIAIISVLKLTKLNGGKTNGKSKRRSTSL